MTSSSQGEPPKRFGNRGLENVPGTEQGFKGRGNVINEGLSNVTNDVLLKSINDKTQFDNWL